MSSSIIIIFLLFLFYFVQLPFLLQNADSLIPNFQDGYRYPVLYPSNNNQLSIPDYTSSNLNTKLQSIYILDISGGYKIAPHGPFNPLAPSFAPSQSTPDSILDLAKNRSPPPNPFSSPAPSSPSSTVDGVIQKIEPSLYTKISSDIDKYKITFDMLYHTCKAFPLSGCNTHLKNYNFGELKEMSDIAKNNLELYKISYSPTAETQFKKANFVLTGCFMDISITTPKLLQTVLGKFDNIIHNFMNTISWGDDSIETIQKDFSTLLKIKQQLGLPDPIISNCP